MQRFTDYVNGSLSEATENKLLEQYKKKTLDEMDQRFFEVKKTGGIADAKVIEDLIISEYGDIKNNYAAYFKKETAKKKAKQSAVLNTLGSVIYILGLVTAFLAISFATRKWETTWIIIVDGVLLWTVYLLSLCVKKFSVMKRIFHIFARLSLFGAAVCFTVAIFLLTVALADWQNGWVIIIAGLIAAFLSDGLFAVITKAKLTILYWLLYIPAIGALTFVIIGALHILHWGVAWIIIPLSLIADLALVFAAIAKNKEDDKEVADIWNES